jgi:ATP-binding cassette subfamily A (ABC1) protein 3
VGIAMIGNPPIILLDEPSNGMDPEARRFMWSVIHKISSKRKKSSVILTTHSMEEAETLCRRMGIMVGGQFKCLGTSQYIKDKYGFGYEIDIRIMNIPVSERDLFLVKIGKEKGIIYYINIKIKIKKFFF